ncbi:unnamed protein product, partial [Coregonus sp. 'balchen']
RSPISNVTRWLTTTHSMGYSVSEQTIMDMELTILKTLDFRLNTSSGLCTDSPGGHNDSSIPVEHLHHLSRHVLQFTYLQRTAFYNSLLVATTQGLSHLTDRGRLRPKRHCIPYSVLLLTRAISSRSLPLSMLVTVGHVSSVKTNRKTFVSVTEGCTLLGVGVIAVGAYILNVTNWQQVMVYHITGISVKSISDFTHITLIHITKNSLCTSVIQRGSRGGCPAGCQSTDRVSRRLVGELHHTDPLPPSSSSDDSSNRLVLGPSGSSCWVLLTSWDCLRVQLVLGGEASSPSQMGLALLGLMGLRCSSSCSGLSVGVSQAAQHLSAERSGVTDYSCLKHLREG